jgi:hypothetical protein
MAPDGIQASDHDCQQIVEVMRYTAGQLAHGLHLLGLDQGGLGLAAFRHLDFQLLGALRHALLKRLVQMAQLVIQARGLSQGSLEVPRLQLDFRPRPIERFGESSRPSRCITGCGGQSRGCSAGTFGLQESCEERKGSGIEIPGGQSWVAANQGEDCSIHVNEGADRCEGTCIGKRDFAADFTRRAAAGQKCSPTRPPW